MKGVLLVCCSECPNNINSTPTKKIITVDDDAKYLLPCIPQFLLLIDK